MRIVWQQTILMKYHALFVILENKYISWLSTGSTQEEPSLYNWKIVDGT